MNNRVLVAMSGGVDSSAAAALLLERGYEVAGATMKLYDGADAALRGCCSADDVDDARDVCRRLNIEHYVFNFKDDFGTEVIGKFVNEYLCGLTPNPCLDCNRKMKFEKFAERALLLGFDYIATGHYAIVGDGGASLKKGADSRKDQSYALYGVTKDALKRLLLPIGGYTKDYIREIARKYNLPTSDKPDSQDICFVESGDYVSFIEERTGNKTEQGDFLDTSNNVIGRHNGALRYTTGQRKGLNFSSGSVGLNERLYVVAKNMNKNTVTLGTEADLYSRAFTVRDINWLAADELENPKRCAVKIRYNGGEYAATITPTADGRVSVEFDEPQRAVTVGQAAVFYDDDIVLGGGIIETSQ